MANLRPTPVKLLCAITALMGVAGTLMLAGFINGPQPGSGPEHGERLTAATPTPSIGETSSTGALKHPPALLTSDSPGNNAAATTELRAVAQRIHEALSVAHMSEAACTAVKSDLIAITEALPVGSELWAWSMDRVEACFSSGLRDRAANGALFRRLALREPSSARVLRLLAEHYLALNRYAIAVPLLRKAAELEEGPQLLTKLARAELAAATDLRRLGGSERDIAQHLGSAQRAYERAMSLSGANADPWMIQGAAQVRLESGDPVGAIALADRALQSAAFTPTSDSQAFAKAGLYVNVGGIYYRAGQQETGIAYMDQGISMVAKAEHRDVLMQLKATFVNS